jgi:tetratricopeptide (TPR) repeat protein
LPAASLVASVLAFLGLTLGGLFYEHTQRIAGAERTQRILAHEDNGNRLIDQARDAATEVALTHAAVELSAFQETIRSEDRLQALGERVAESIGVVERRLELLRSQVAGRERDRLDRARFQTFLNLRNQAQLHASGINLDLSDRMANIRGSARKALAIYARDPKSPETAWSLVDTLPVALIKPEQTRVAESCYDLLLILSQAMQEPTEGLRVLDRAARLRPEPTAAYHLRRAECLARTRDLAGRDREEALAGQRPLVTALDHFLIGREHCFRRQYGQAIRSLDTAVRLDPNQTAAHLLLAVSYYNHQPKRLSEARTSLSTCIGSHPGLLGLYLLRALIYGEEGNIDAAEADYASAIERQPGDDYRYALLVNRGAMYLRAGRLDQSLVDLQAAIRLKPALYQAHTTLAQLHERRRQLEEAARRFTLAIDRSSDPAILAGLYRSRALLYAHRKDLTSEQRSAALHDLDEAIRRQPAESPQAADDHVNRARLLFGAARHDESLTSCDSAIRLVSGHPEAHRQRIATLMALKRYDDVLVSCDAYLAREQPTVEILEISGLARLTTENYPGAISDLTRAIATLPEPQPEVKTRLLNRRGWAYHFADAPRLALADFEASLKLVDDQSDAFCGRGLARIRLGQWRLAVADADTAIRLTRLTPTSEDGADVKSQTYFNAARIYAQAVEYAAREVSREGQRAVSLYRRYHARALALLDEALRHVPDATRRQVILDDPALKPLRLNRGMVSTSKAMN